VQGTRRPQLQSLYDVFVAIRDDEGQHVSTMRNCQRGGNAMHSPHDSQAVEGSASGATISGGASAEMCDGLVDCAVNNPTGWRSSSKNQ
jgi:ubiquinol oxidase